MSGLGTDPTSTGAAPVSAAPAGVSRAGGPGSRRRGRARWLALGVGLLWLYAAWSPWLFFRAPGGGLSTLDLAGLGGFAAGNPLDVLLWPFWVGAITPLGLILAPWLWSRRFHVVAGALFVVWAVLSVLQLIAAAIALGGIVGSGAPLSVLLPGAGTGLAPDFGGVVALVALVLVGLAAARLASHTLFIIRRDGWLKAFEGGVRMRPRADDPLAAHARAGLISGGAGTLTAGALIWGLAFVWLPWAVPPCTITRSGGSCPGVAARVVMDLAARPAVWFLDPGIFRAAIPALAVATGLMAIYAAWHLTVDWWLVVWLAAWLVLASGMVALGMLGTSVLVRAGGDFTAYPAGVIAAFGVAVGWLGIIPLVWAAYLNHREGARGGVRLA